MSDRPTLEQFDFTGDVEVIDDPKAEFFRHTADLLLHALEPEIGRPHRSGLPEVIHQPHQPNKRRRKAELREATITFGKEDCLFRVTEDPANSHRRAVEVIHSNLRDHFLRYGRTRVALDLDGVSAVSVEDTETPNYSGPRPAEFMGYQLSEGAVISPDDLVAIWEIPSGTEIRGSEFPDGSVDEVLLLTKEAEEL